MNDQNRAALDDYYANAGSWNSDRVQLLKSSQRAAWRVAGAATIVAVLEAGALLLLTPLKTVEPYTLLVDRTTGFVQPLKPLDPERLAPDTALTQSFLVQYVLARESFDFATVSQSYRKVALMSSDRARSSYLAAMQVNSPQSPLVTFARGTIVETKVKSVSPVGSDTSLVRFDTIRSDANGRPHSPMQWIAVIRYRYSAEPIKLEDRFTNPLGFQVVHYRKDPEALPVSSTPQASQGALPQTVSARAAPVTAAASTMPLGTAPNELPRP